MYFSLTGSFLTIKCVKMKPFSELSAEELAMENLFIRWVRFPDDPPIRSFWENWILKYPAMRETVANAREIVLTASDWKPEMLSGQEVNSIWDRIINSLDIRAEREPGEASGGLLRPRLNTKSIILGIISMAVLMMLYFFLFSATR